MRYYYTPWFTQFRNEFQQFNRVKDPHGQLYFLAAPSNFSYQAEIYLYRRDQSQYHQIHRTYHMLENHKIQDQMTTLIGEQLASIPIQRGPRHHRKESNQVNNKKFKEETTSIPIQRGPRMTRKHPIQNVTTLIDEQASIPIQRGPRHFRKEYNYVKHKNQKEETTSAIRTEVTKKSIQQVDNVSPPISNEEKKICINCEDPPTEIQETISFSINNLSPENVDAKAKEFSEILKEQYYLWFARYIVTKRAKLEPNFHDLYLELIEKVMSKSLSQEILQVTYKTIKIMLKSDLIRSSMEERSFLNNLGSWLGKIRIYKNQALIDSEINLESMIIDAYETGSMNVVIPFISKIFEPIKKISAYQPPNTRDILGLLMEIYSMPNLKMNLIFAIEIIFRNLGVDMKEISATTLLQDKARLVEGNSDFSDKGRQRSR